MAGGVRNVMTNMDADEIHDALLDTFEKWVNFAMGMGSLGGRILQSPSGRLASAVRAESNPDGNVVAVYIDPEAQDELDKIGGHKGFSLKSRMLRSGQPGVRRSKAGNLYRYVQVSGSLPGQGGTGPLDTNKIKNLFTSERTQTGALMGINKNLARMWLSAARKSRIMSGRVRTMSYRPGSARWYIPQMPAYNVKRLLRQMVPAQIRDRII